MLFASHPHVRASTPPASTRMSFTPLSSIAVGVPSSRVASLPKVLPSSENATETDVGWKISSPCRSGIEHHRVNAGPVRGQGRPTILTLKRLPCRVAVRRCPPFPVDECCCLRARGTSASTGKVGAPAIRVAVWKTLRSPGR